MIDPKRLHKLSRWFWLHRLGLLSDWVQRLNYALTSCDIPGTVKIADSARFQHYGCGVIIHLWTVIGENVMIHPHVVIGCQVRNGVPTQVDLIEIGDGAQIGAGAKIIASGPLKIGEGAHIGANAVVLESVPAGATAVGIPARILPAKHDRPPAPQPAHA